MSRNDKEFRKSLKGPDKFQITAAKTLDWFRANAGLLAALIVPAILVVVGIWGWKIYTAHQAAERQVALGQVEEIFMDEAQKAEEKRESIRNEFAEVEKTLAEAGNEGGSTLLAKKAELEKKIKAVRPDHTESLAGYQRIFNEYPNKPEGWVAGLKAATLQLEQKDYKAAEEIVQTVLKQAANDHFFQVQAGLLHLGILEQLGNYDGAIREADRLLEIVSDDVKPQILLAKGRVQLAKESKTEARATFDSIINSYGTSPEAEKARSFKALLNG